MIYDGIHLCVYNLHTSSVMFTCLRHIEIGVIPDGPSPETMIDAQHLHGALKVWSIISTHPYLKLFHDFSSAEYFRASYQTVVPLRIIYSQVNVTITNTCLSRYICHFLNFLKCLFSRKLWLGTFLYVSLFCTHSNKVFVY